MAIRMVVFLFFAALAAFAQKTQEGKISAGTELYVSEPFQRYNAYVGVDRIRLTFGSVNSEGIFFHQAQAGFMAINHESEHRDTKLILSLGVANGTQKTFPTVGLDLEHGTERYAAASHIEFFFPEGEHQWFMTAEPLGEGLFHVSKKIFVGGTSSCYDGRHFHELQGEREIICFVGPAVMWKHGHFSAVASVEKKVFSPAETPGTIVAGSVAYHFNFGGHHARP